MRSSLERLFTTGMAIGALGIAPEVLAGHQPVTTTFDVHPFVQTNGTCNSPAVIEACDLRPGAGFFVDVPSLPVFGHINPDVDVMSLLVNNPNAAKGTTVGDVNAFAVTFDITGGGTKLVNFEDRSDPMGNGVSQYQQAGAGFVTIDGVTLPLGLEAVLVTGTNDNQVNVYCQRQNGVPIRNWPSDSGLRGPGDDSRINKLEFCWSRGPSLLDQVDVIAVGDRYNPSGGTRTADVVQALLSPDGPLNISGLPPKIAFFCDPGTRQDGATPDEFFEISCAASLGQITDLEGQGIGTGNPTFLATSGGGVTTP